MFSRRLPADLEPNPLSRALAARRAAGQGFLDLTLSNPTQAGLAPSPQALASALAAPAAAVYAPDPRGLPAAREAIAAYYRERGAAVGADSLHLCAGTSDAYGYLFKLLADAGDRVLAPRPSYPLLGMLAALDGVELDFYPLCPDNDGVWRPDLAALAAGFGPRTRAVVVVAPHNPLGGRLRRAELRALGEICAERGAPLIVDEVFADYPAAEGERRARRADHADTAAGGAAGAPTFVLSGLSKVCGLPQLKLSWIQIDGPPSWRVAAQERLDFIADAYLSAGGPVQHAAPALLGARAAAQAAIQGRLQTNASALTRLAAAGAGVRLVPREAGWYAVLETDRDLDEEEFVLSLLARDGVLVHPGFFFDFPSDGYLVVSLLPRPDDFAAGVRRLLARLR